MLVEESSVPFNNALGVGRDIQPSSNLSWDETALLNDIINKSRQGAEAYLLRIQEQLRHTGHAGHFSEFLRIVKDLKDKRIDPPSFIRTIAARFQLFHVSPELISDSISILPTDCLLQVQHPNKKGSFVATLRYPANTTVPEHIVFHKGWQEPVGFFGHPGPTPNPSPPRVNHVSGSLKRKRHVNLQRNGAVVFSQGGLEVPSNDIKLRRSKRLRLQKEWNSMNVSTSSLVVPSSATKLTVAAVVSLFTDVLSNRTKRRRLMECNGERAQLILDTMQALVDVPDILPSSKLKLKQALIKLSAKCNLPPSCFSLYGLEIDDFSPSDAPDGSFGEIYSGVFHKQPLCIKVVKLRHKSNMDKAISAFLKEGVTWGQINHPNILPFYGIYRLQDKYNRLSLISPWLANGNVNIYLENNPTANRHLLVYDIIQGITHLHTEGIVHGDLKGPNILVTKKGRACIADFGLATMSYEKNPNWTSLRSSVALGGTLRWQAPELLEDDASEPTASADVYAFGSIMYEIFTGQAPFSEVSQHIRVMRLILDGKQPTKPAPTHPTWTQWGLTEKIWELMVQCWETDPNTRPLAAKIAKTVAGFGRNDTRPIDSDEYLSPSAFRHTVHAKLNPLSEETVEKVVRWLREEESGLKR